MKICNLLTYGVFDTNLARAGKKRSVARTTLLFEIEYYISSSGTATINDRTYDIAPGTLLCVKPGQKRSSVFPFRCYYLHIELPADSPYFELLMQAPDFYQIIDRHTYTGIFESLIAHLLQEGYNCESDFVNAKLLELFYHLKNDSQNNRNCLEHFETNQYHFIPYVLEYMQLNFHRQITLTELADIAGYSPNYFHHVFRKVMGLTPQEFLMEERVQKAKLLLIKTDKTLSEIAYECGFCSQSHLCARFKRKVFCTPGEYRQQNMNRYRG